MGRRRRSYTRTPRMGARCPIVIGWAFAAVVGLASLAGLLYLVGHGSPFGLPNVWEQIAKAATKSAPALTLSLLLATEIAWSVRRLSFEWLAWKPGAIEVSQFSVGNVRETAKGDKPPPNVDALCLSFRERLAELRMQAPAPLPGAVPQGDFLDVLGTGGVDARNLFGTLINLLKAARPTHAYEIRGVLLERDDPRGCGVSVQVTCLPGRARSPVTVWDSSWDTAVRQAADVATAALLPSTRLCRDQWASWRRFPMPAGLLHAYERGASLEQDRRYDEALDAYYEVLRLDPMNLTVRLQVGKLQEKLGLPLDAFATYQAILTVAEPGGRRVAWTRYRPAARRQRRHARLVARYRRIVLMGGAEFANQWRHPPEATPTRRDERRTALRAGLRERLEQELERAGRHRPRAGLKEHRETGRWHLSRSRQIARVGTHSLDQLLADRPNPRAVAGEAVDGQELERVAYRELRELLALAALDAAPSVRRWALFDRRSFLAAPSVKLTQLCIEERLSWLQRQLGSADAAWPPDPTELTNTVHDIEGRVRFASWHEHYNAACVHAIPLLDDKLAADVQDRLADATVARLERATASADSAYIATRRDWLVAEDPDFMGLRATLAFKRFEAMFFPSATPAAVRPRDVQLLESSRHVQALLVATAERWQKEWRERGRTLDRRTDIHAVLGWWADEYEAWRLVRSVAVDYRDWGTRLKLVTTMGAWSERYHFSPLDVPAPRYEQRPVGRGLYSPVGDGDRPPQVEADCDRAIKAADARLASLVRALPEPLPRGEDPQILRDIGSWQARLKQIGLIGQEPGRYFIAHVCDCHAALWQLLQAWLEHDAGPGATADPNHDPEGDFCKQVAKAHSLWCTAYDWWRPRDVVLALASRDRRSGGVPPLRVLRWQTSEWWHDRSTVEP